MAPDAVRRGVTGGVVTRFAPSPNGDLHLGHVYSAAVGYGIARRSGGAFLVRIEDIDIARSRDQFVFNILDDLAWMGIAWEQPVLRQSRCFADYAAAALRLRDLGIVYPCFATRGDIAAAVARHVATGGGWPSDPDGAPLYPWTSSSAQNSDAVRRLESGEPYALRIDMGKAVAVAREMLGGHPLTFTAVDARGCETIVPAAPERWGDAVVVRKDIPASYHLAVVVDDARQGVTLVTRGQDLYAATGFHRLLQVLLGLPEPRYHHHRLLLDEHGRKLSKSAGSTSLQSLRAAGLTPAQVRNLVGIPPPE